MITLNLKGYFISSVKKWAISGLPSLSFSIELTVNKSRNKLLMMTEFKPQISDVRSNQAAICASATAYLCIYYLISMSSSLFCCLIFLCLQDF